MLFGKVCYEWISSLLINKNHLFVQFVLQSPCIASDSAVCLGRNS